MCPKGCGTRLKLHERETTSKDTLCIGDGIKLTPPKLCCYVCKDRDCYGMKEGIPVVEDGKRTSTTLAYCVVSD